MPSDGDRRIRSVAVVGAGVVGLSAALAFARSLPGVQVTMVETPADPAALADIMPGSWPSIHRFHAAIGLTEAEVIAAGAATPRLATRLEAWSPDGAPWFHLHGLYGVPIGGAPFHELWARARRQGRALPFDRYAAAGVLAGAGQFVRPEDDARSPLSTYDYGLRLEMGRYANLLRRLAGARGVVRLHGSVQGVDRREDGGISALRLDGGRTLAADLFLDCGGPAAPLLSLVDPGFEDWSGWLPCDRLAVSLGPPTPPNPVDVITATAGGWTASWALIEGELRAQAYASGARTPQAARPGDERALLAENVIRPGRRPRPWRRNVLAVGDAAVAVDPLGAANLHMAHSAIARALDLLPGRDADELETREYNRRTEQEVLLLRDFQALHYALAPTGPRGPVPDSLAHMLDQFERRGRLPLLEEDPFGKEIWIAAMIGLGAIPRAASPRAAEVSEAEADLVMADLAAGFATLPGQLPAYPAYLARIFRR